MTSFLRFLFLSLLIVGTTTPDVFAQKSPLTITGRVVDRESQSPIEFATVILGARATEQAIKGTTTDADGQFVLTTGERNSYVTISFIGFVTQQLQDFEVVAGKIDLGTIVLVADSELLDEVVVRAEKSQTEFKLDKRVFNVGKDLSSTGASALEILNNVPSVNVNIEGEISLRGSTGVQILINGKPSVLASDQGNALGTITAEMIEKIEVITNPSAKYDAEGTTGIINIVIKKEERKGVNGSLSVNTGWPHNHSIGLSLNRRTEKFNLFSQLGVGYRELPREVININEDLVQGITVTSEGNEFRNENFYNLILGTDYHINKNNVLTLSGSFAYEIEDQPSNYQLSRTNAQDSTLARWTREETTEATNPKWQYELQYKRDFKDHKEHDLLFSALGNFFGKDQSSDFVNTFESGTELFGNQQTRTNFQEARYTFKLDYTRPFAEKWTLETGTQYVLQNVSNDFAVDDWINGEWVSDANLTNIFDYDQKVLGVYATSAYEGPAWGLKLGLRLEHTDLKTLLVTTQEANDQKYHNFFPTLHTSYKLTEAFSIQAGYSRRIYRPRLWDLNPFFNIRNNFSIRTGNPELLPELTDSYELASIWILNKASLNFTLYHRSTTDVIERISTVEDNVNVFKPLNIGLNKAYGLEFNTKYQPTKWLVVQGDVNYSLFQREGSLEEVSFDFSAAQWTTKWNAKFKLPGNIDTELTGQYQSAFQTVQGRRADNLFADWGLRKKIGKGKAVVSMSVRDIFASRVQESEADQPTFYLFQRRQRGRFITLGFSYGFGKGEAMEYSGGRRRR